MMIRENLNWVIDKKLFESMLKLIYYLKKNSVLISAFTIFKNVLQLSIFKKKKNIPYIYEICAACTVNKILQRIMNYNVLILFCKK